MELDAVNDPASSSPTSFNVALPSSSSISEFWPESQHFVALPHDLQRSITSQIGSIHIGFSLLLALVNVIQPRGKAYATSIALVHHLPWVVDSIQALWQHFRRWTTTSEKRLLYDEVMLIYLQLLETSLFPLATPEDRPSTSLKTAQALTSSLTELLDNLSTPPASEASQVRLASIFARLRSIVTSPSANTSTLRRRQDAIASFILQDLEKSIAMICQDMEHFSKFHKDLQVWVEQYT